MSPVTFDLMTPKSNQFIGSARYIHDLSLTGIHQSVLEITRSPEQDLQTYGRTTQKNNDSGYFVAEAWKCSISKIWFQLSLEITKLFFRRWSTREALTRHNYKEGACFCISCIITCRVGHCVVSNREVVSRIVGGCQCLVTRVICCCRWCPGYYSCIIPNVCGDVLITWASTNDWILIICEKDYMR